MTAWEAASKWTAAKPAAIALAIGLVARLRARAAPNHPGLTSSPVSPDASETPLTLVQEFKARATEAGARWARACGMPERKAVPQCSDGKTDAHSK